MSGFVRPADWLRQLFTSSQTGPVNPTSVSDDVSLVQPYDGGGYPLFNPEQWALEVTTTPAAAAATTSLFTCPDTSICRVLAMAAVKTAGVAPDVHFRVETAVISLAISVSQTLPAVEQIGFAPTCPIIGPGHKITGRHFGGDGSTIVVYRLYLVVVPLGTVFTV